MDEAGMTLQELHSELKHIFRPALGRTGVSDRLAGRSLTPEFIDAVATICFPETDVSALRAKHGRAVLASHVQHADRRQTDVTPVVTPLVLAELHQQLDASRSGQGEEGTQQIQRLFFENVQLRLRVAQLAKRLDAADSALRVLTSERDEARRQNAVHFRALTRAQERLREATEQITGKSKPSPRSAQGGSPGAGGESEEGGKDGPPDQAGPDLGGKSSGPRRPGPGLSGGESTSWRPTNPAAGGVGSSVQQLATHPADGLDAVATSVVDALPSVVLPIEFEAFYLQNAARYHAYARVQLDSDHLARDLVHDTFTFIAMNWQQFLGQERPAEWAWGILRESVTAQVGKVVTKQATVVGALQKARITFEAADSEVGLYAAISALPKRQFDVVVLRYLLGYSFDVVSDLLGISSATVRSIASHARQRIANDLINTHTLR